MRIISQRRILGLLISRDLKVKYSDSALGYVWTVLEPLLMGAVYWFVFTQVFHRGKGDPQPYIVFLLLGLLPWQWANSVITGASRSISSEAKLVRSVDVVREIWVLRTVGSKFVEFIFSIPVLIVFMIAFRKGADWRLVMWIPAVGLQWLALLGIAMFLAPVSVMMTDMERIVRIVVRVLFYMCPVLYSQDTILKSQTIPHLVKVAYSWNPFTAILGMYRAGVYRHQMPDVDTILKGAIVSLVLFVAGVWTFRRMESAMLKEI